MSVEEETTPALYHHCLAAYREMLAEATKQELEGIEGMVYQGYLTALFADKLHLSVPYYTHVTRALKKMGCVRQLRRGGSSTESQWLLLYEPTEQLFQNKVGTARERVRYVTYNEFAALQQRLTDMNNRLLKLERMLGQ